MKWLVITKYGDQIIVEAEDFYELHGKVDSDEVVAVIKCNLEESVFQ